MKDFIKKNKFNIIIMLIYSLTTLIAVIFHENWRDEAQSWLIARNLNFIDIFKQMRYEGHPCLWHFIIAPFAKLGFPYFTENIISWIIMNISAFLILKKSPFDKFIKILLLASAPFIYFYTVISRSYCLIPLAISLIAITYTNRHTKPIQYILSIVLLAHTHVLMMGLVGILLIVFFYEEIHQYKKMSGDEKRTILFSFAIAFIGLMLLFIQMFSSINPDAYVEGNFEINRGKILLFYKIILSIALNNVGLKSYVLGIIILIISYIFTTYQIINNRKNMLMLLFAICYQLFVYLFIYPDLAYQKVMTTLFVIIFFAWIQKDENRENSKNKSNLFLEIYLVFILAFSCILGARFVIKEIKYNYSYAKQTGEYISKNLPKNSTLIASNIPIATSIIPYTDEYKFWSPQIDDYFTFTTWSKTIRTNYTLENFREKIISKFKNEDNIYFIYCYNWKEEGLEEFIENTRSRGNI